MIPIERVTWTETDPTPTQLRRFFRLLEDGTITKDRLETLLKGEVEIHTVPQIIEKVVPPLNWNDVYKTLEMSEGKVGTTEWYQNKLGDLKLSSQKLAELESTGIYPVPVLKGATCCAVVRGLQELGVRIRNGYPKIDEMINQQDRHPDRSGSYVAFFRKSREAELEYGDLSAAACREKGLRSITLLERLLLGMAVFMATGKHLDSGSETLCAGSYAQHKVPCVKFDYNQVCIAWRLADYTKPKLCTRQLLQLAPHLYQS